jgi:hypothetical protein
MSFVQQPERPLSIISPRIASYQLADEFAKAADFKKFTPVFRDIVARRIEEKLHITDLQWWEVVSEQIYTQWAYNQLSKANKALCVDICSLIDRAQLTRDRRLLF